MDTIADAATPETIALAAKRLGCRSVAYTYNDPVIFHEYAIDVAIACREQGVRSVAVTAGYVHADPRAEFYRHMDAANVDLKSFSENFYHRLTGAHLQPVLETLEYLRRETTVWFEITTLLIPGENDTDQELNAMTTWIREHLGVDTPLHLSAFHPAWKMQDKPPTPANTLFRACDIARRNGLRYVYAGNIADTKSGSTHCHRCGQRLIGRTGYQISTWNLTKDGLCTQCQAPCAGVFEPHPGDWGARRQVVRLAEYR